MSKEYYIIDLGSSSVKVYLTNGAKVNLLEKKSYKLVNKYSEENPFIMDNEDKKAIVSIFKELKEQYALNKNNCKLFATGIYRGIKNKKEFINYFYNATLLSFNIIDQELETFYLENALVDISNTIGNTIIFNIGSGSTEIIFCINGEIIDRVNYKWGVQYIRTKFPSINDIDDSAYLSEVVGYIKTLLKSRYNEKFTNAIYTGGELTYMLKTKYPLKMNRVFNDQNHPYSITFNDFYNYNKDIFDKNSISDLRSLMPENPIWMDGARACSAIAQAICEKYGVQNIVPSDFNMVDGIVKKDARKVVLCGSFNKHLDRIGELIKKIQNKKIEILSPKSTTAIDKIDDFVILHGDEIEENCKWKLENNHLECIEKSDYVIICNFDGYIGVSTAIEMGYALKCGKKIVFIEEKNLNSYFCGPCEVGLLLD